MGLSHEFLSTFVCGLSISYFLYHAKSDQENRHRSKYVKHSEFSTKSWLLWVREEMGVK